MSLRSVRAGALLVYLALSPSRSHSREVIAARLWPDLTSDRGRHRLRQALAELRQTVGEDAVVSEGREHLRLVAVWTEQVTLESALRSGRHSDLDAALQECLGEPLEGLYDDWAVTARQGLEELYARAQLAARSVPPEAPPSPSSAFAAPVPSALNRFWGRQEELSQAIHWIRDPSVRLVTILGPGGVGKTRFAAEVAQQWKEPALWVSLGSLDDPERFLEVVQERLLGPDCAVTGAALVGLQAQLSRLDQPLLVLDNLEQLSGSIVQRQLLSLLGMVPRLTCLTTSRVPLGLSGEREFWLAPLPPAAAIALFEDRACSVRPDFSLNLGNQEPVAEICQRLEGIPLALELAAVRLRALSPAQILSQLEHPLEFLVRTRPGGEERHSSLRTAITWSYQLLPERERRLFRALSVFRGGFTLEAAQDVLEEPGILTVLEYLRDQSLIVVRDQGEEVRYDLLETLREFAREQLTPPEKERLEHNHATYYCSWGEAVTTQLVGPELVHYLKRMDSERPNLLQAYETRAQRGEDEVLLRWGGIMVQYFLVRAEHRECLNRMEPVLERMAEGIATAPPELARLWVRRAGGLGTVLRDMGNVDGARAWLRRALDVALLLDDTERIAYSYLYLGVVAHLLGELDEAERLGREAVGLFRTLPTTLYLGIALARLAMTQVEQGRPEEASALLDDAETIHRQLHNNRGIYETQLRRARLFLSRGELAQAGNLLCEIGQGFLEFNDLGNLPLLIETWQSVFQQATSDPVLIAWILGHLEVPNRSMETNGSPKTLAVRAALRRAGILELGPTLWEHHYREGARMLSVQLLEHCEERYHRLFPPEKSFLGE